MRVLKGFCFALVPLATCVAAIELALRWIAPEAPVAIGAGFELAGKHIAFDRESTSGWRLTDRPEPRQRIADRRLVVLLGGSNTQNFPHPLLARELDRRLAQSGLAVDVVNLGRAGFGSERVALLCEKALELEPDLVLVYCGHNEILERQFRQDLEREWSGWSARLAGLFAPLASFRALVAAFSVDSGADRPDGRRGGHAGNAPARRAAAEQDKFASYTLADTEEQLERFRHNLERMAASAERRGVPLAFSTVIWNRLSPPFVSNRPPHTSADDWRRVEELRAELRAAWPASLGAFDPEVGLLERPYEWNWNARSGSRAAAQAVPALRELGGPLGERAPLWHPPERWQPSLFAFVQQIADFCARRVAPADREALAACARLVDALQSLCPDLPDVLFRRAVLTWLAGTDDALAAECFERAAELDRAPRKASRRVNDIVRAVARHTGAALLDADRLFSQRTPGGPGGGEPGEPGGIVGWEVMLDHCHLHPGAYAVLMSDLADFAAPLLAPRSPSGARR